jgi:hypothetical protein
MIIEESKAQNIVLIGGDYDREMYEFPAMRNLVCVNPGLDPASQASN